MFSILQQVDPMITINFMILGYAVMWVIAAFYVGYLFVEQRNLERDIQTLHRLLKEEMK